MRLVFANFAHYKLIIIFSHPKRMATVEAAQIYTHTCMCITYSVHILTLFTDFSSSRINVNANLYFLNGRGDYNRWLDDIAPYRQRHSTKHTHTHSCHWQTSGIASGGQKKAADGCVGGSMCVHLVSTRTPDNEYHNNLSW